MPNRRKLKPKRYDKFEQSHSQPQPTTSTSSTQVEEYVPQRVSKRPNTDLLHLENNKRRCYGLMHPPCATVNLANNRLKKLRQNLQAGLKIPNASTTTSSKDTPISLTVPAATTMEPVSPCGSAKNIYQNLSKWTSPQGSSSSKNSANDRLKKLRQVINESNYTGSPKFSDSSGKPNHSRTLNEISSYTPQCSVVNTPTSQQLQKKYLFDRGDISNSCSLNRTNQFSSNINKNLVEIKGSTQKMGNIDKPSKNLSSRILKIRENTEQLTNSVNGDVFSKSVSPPKITSSVSERLKLVRNFPSEAFNPSSSEHIHTGQQGTLKSSTPTSNCVKLNRDFIPLMNKGFNTLNNQNNDKNFKNIPISENLSPKNQYVDTQKQPMAISERLKLIRQSSSPLTLSSDAKTVRPHNLNYNLDLNNTVNNKDTIKTTPLSKKSPKSYDTSLNKPFVNSSLDLLKTQKLSSPISDRLKIHRASFSGDSKNIRASNVNNNLDSRNQVHDKVDNIKTTHSSERITMKSNVQLNSTDVFDTQTQNAPISVRKQLKRKSCTPLSPTTNAKNVMMFTFKEPSTPILTQESLTTLNNPAPALKDQDEFEAKMKMTASWIRNQQFNEPLLNTSEVPDRVNAQNSFNTSSGRSDVATHGNIDDSEEMEWTNAEPDNSATEIVKKTDNIPQENENVPTIDAQPKIQKADKEKFLCIVVDTNIFISELAKLTDVLNLKISGPIQPLIYIPWMVTTELDEIKDRSGDSHLKKQAFNAIKFINKALSEENPRVKGQSISDMGTQKHIGSSPDDKIMGTCLQALEKYESVILLSNDLNLKNKAMINNITASSANEIIMKIISRLVKTTKTQKIKQKMGMLCSEIICESAKEAYGDVWIKMDMLSNPPWPFLDCLKRFKKYWTAVFQDKLLKHFLPALDKLHKLMSDNKDISDDSPNYVEFVKLSLNLCIFLKDIEDYRGSIENIISDITKIG